RFSGETLIDVRTEAESFCVANGTVAEFAEAVYRKVAESMKSDHLVEPEAVKLLVGNDNFEVAKLMTMSEQKMTPFFGERFAGQESSCMIIVADDEDAFESVRTFMKNTNLARLYSNPARDSVEILRETLRQVHTKTKLKDIVEEAPSVIYFGGPLMQRDYLRETLHK
ncbi:unnamed protein product, partial [Amoebophrya sp. A25]